ncbi:DUF4760 domain-containing protein [Aliivibrio fischeri]|nr:DUF4760 domain-containing protein [Aliivibrio fischeri]
MKKILMINASFLAGVAVCSFVYVGVPTLLNKDYYPLASALAVLLSATIALSSAYLTVSNHNKRTREKNTIDVIGQGKGKIGEEYLFVKNFIEANKHDKKQALEYLARNNIDIVEMRPTLEKLNELEHLCEGVFKKFYDKDILRDNRGAAIIYIWETLKPYILERRKIQNERIAQHQSFSQRKENQPFYWLEQAYSLFTNNNQASDNELRLLIIANLLLVVPCLPAIITILSMGT